VSVNQQKFIKKAELISFDLEHRKKIKFNISKYDKAVEAGFMRYKDIELAKDRASYIKSIAIDNLSSLLIDFDKNCINNGIEVLWAQTDAEVLAYLKSIIKSNNIRSIVKSKSMTTEEIEFNEFAEHLHLDNLETDLGEFIVQVAGEKPYHIVTPAMHKSKEDIDELFHTKFNTPTGSTPEELTAFVRELLREKFVSADLGITGANFLIADTGAIALTENEGNGLLTASYPKVHVVIAGIEKILPKMADLGLFWPLLSSHGTGQQVTVYNSILSGSKKTNEVDGPEKMYVILLDNGRSQLYSEPILYKGLACIRCGACLNGCPIYKNIGGYTYNSTYSGPIGSIITPHFKGFEQFKHLSFASSLCGKCGEVCPVRIPLPELLLHNRNISVEKGYNGIAEKVAFNFMSRALLSRILMNLGGGRVKSFFASLAQHSIIGKKRKLPLFSKKTFSQQWKQLKRY